MDIKKAVLPMPLVGLLLGGPALAQVQVPEQNVGASGGQDQPNPPEPSKEEKAKEEKAEDIIPGKVSGSAYVTNNYIFRGISQTDNRAAIQGFLGYKITADEAGLKDVPVGVYGSVWGSNVHFNDGNKGATVELDWSFGLFGDIGDTGLSWTVGAIYYNYPGAANSLNYDYWEFVPSLSYAVNDWLSVTGTLNYSNDFFGSSGSAYYPNLGVNVKIPSPVEWAKLSAFGFTGHQWIEKQRVYGVKDYQNWLLGVTVNIKGIDFSAAYSDTSLDKKDCFAGQNLCDAKAVLTMSYSF